ncbi:hypothetical protein ACXR2W_13845 [Leucobacter sp. HY1908]
MSIHGIQNQPTNPGTNPGTGVHASHASITLIGNDGTEHGTPALPAAHPDPQPELPPVRLTCAAGCACWRAIESGQTPSRSLEADELLSWLVALKGPLRSGLAHNRMYHHIRTTQPASPLNVGYVGIARGLAAFGVTPTHYSALHDAFRRLRPDRVVAALGGERAANAHGIRFVTHEKLPETPLLKWVEFCPLLWQEDGPVASALLATQ